MGSSRETSCLVKRDTSFYKVRLDYDNSFRQAGTHCDKNLIALTIISRSARRKIIHVSLGAYYTSVAFRELSREKNSPRSAVFFERLEIKVKFFTLIGFAILVFKPV